jgi:outer membrane protein TolC
LLQNDIAGLYYELVRAEDLTQVNNEAHQLATDQLRRAQSLFELGSVARGDVLQAQVNLAAADRDRIQAANQVESQRARLALALAVPVDAPLEIADPPPPPVDLPGDEDALIQEAISNRPDLRQAAASLAAARANLNAAKWERYPSVGASYSYTKRGDELGELFKQFDQDISYGVGVGLEWQLFDGFSTKGAIERAVAARNTEQQAFEQQRLQVALDVRESLIAIRNASEKIRSAEEGVRLAEESAKLQQALYESGGGTLLEWNNAQVELTRARVSLVDAQVDLHLALAGLELALGR